MNKKKTRKPLYDLMKKALIVLAPAMMMSSCQLDREGQARGVLEEAPINVRAEYPTIRPMEQVIEVHGNLEPVEKVDVVAEVSGIILEIMVDEGDTVKAGDLLAKLDDEESRLSLRQAQAAFRVANSDYKSTKQLYKEGIKSRSEKEKMRRSYQDSLSNLQMARLRVKNAEVRSPIQGVVISRNAEVYRQAGAMEVLFTVGDLSGFKVSITVTEADIGRIKLGQKVRARVDAVAPDPDSFPLVATVDRIQPRVDPQTGTVAVEVGLSDPETGIKPGMFVRLRIVTSTHERALVVPRRALDSGEGNFVWVVDGDGAAMVNVETGLSDQDGIEILSGISEKDLVIVEGHAALTPKSKVNIVNQPTDNPTSDTGGAGIP